MARCPSTKTEIVNSQPVVRRCTRTEGHTDPARDDMHEWMRPGHAVRWPKELPKGDL